MTKVLKRVFPCSADSALSLLCPGLKPVVLAHRNSWFKVMSRASYFSIEYERPQVAVLPVLEGSAIVMVRVKRPLIDDCPLELPAGDAKDGESPRMAALREFVEETGVSIEDPSRFVPELPLSEMPGRMPVLLSIFRVDLSRAEFDSRVPHDNEILRVEAVPFVEVARKLIEGEIYLSSPAAIMSRLLLQTWLNKGALGS